MPYAISKCKQCGSRNTISLQNMAIEISELYDGSFYTVQKCLKCVNKNSKQKFKRRPILFDGHILKEVKDEIQS